MVKDAKPKESKVIGQPRYFATVGIECEKWRCESGDELIGYPAILDIKGLEAAGAITTSEAPEEVEAVDG
tara:strand:+ start:2590 stop:2799 length:210 start_codon:yes stop_codon:yes gene_type:complete